MQATPKPTNISDWNTIVAAFRALADAARNGEPIASPWRTFSTMVESRKDAPPDHMRMLLRSLKEIQGTRQPDALRIMDHGCGSGLNVFYLAALGYQSVFGVNVNDEVDHLNRIGKEIFGTDEIRFIATDGRQLPFDSHTFDFIMSNQVLEHVSDDKIDTYYSEEGRVLKPSGGVFHEAPHLLMPFDGHSRLWFAHYLPRFLRPLAYGVMKTVQQRKILFHKGLVYIRHYDGYLFLRTPRYHRRQVTKQIGLCRDLTFDRLMEPYDYESHDPDTNPLYRRLIVGLIKIPGIGRLFARVFCNAVIMQTIAIKTDAEGNR